MDRRKELHGIEAGWHCALITGFRACHSLLQKNVQMANECGQVWFLKP